MAAVSFFSIIVSRSVHVFHIVDKGGNNDDSASERKTVDPLRATNRQSITPKPNTHSYINT